MAHFIKCSCEQTEYKGYDINNHPINIDLVSQVEMFQESYYPDNEGTPAIMFRGIDIKWVYAKTQKKQRDDDYNKIVNNLCNQSIQSTEAK